MNDADQFSLRKCYAKAWKSFAKWWIPICLLAGGLMVFDGLPRLLAKEESQAMRQIITQIMEAAEAGDLARVEESFPELQATVLAYSHTLLTFILYAAPIASLLTVLLYCTSLMAVKDCRTHYPLKTIMVVSMFQLVIAFVKMLLFFLIPPLGIYIYIKLYFVSLLMLEDEKSMGEALKESWSTTTGSFWPLFAMVAINGTLQFALVPTIIGVIPATGFANTTRATAFSILRSPLA